MDQARTRVGLIGCGAIGNTVAAALSEGQVPGCTLVGVHALESPSIDVPFLHDPDALIEQCDLIVEAAGHGALAAHGPGILEAHRDLLVVSAGALVDEDLHERLTQVGRGRLMVSTGAIGGLDTLRAASMAGPLDHVSLTTTKPSSVLVEDWMSEDMQRDLAEGAGVVTAFAGPAREAVRLFPRSVNVAATVSLVTRGFDDTEVRVIGDPDATSVEHVVRAESTVGSYEFRFQNRASDDNPRTSAITGYSVLRALRDRSARVSIGV